MLTPYLMQNKGKKLEGITKNLTKLKKFDEYVK